MNDLRRLARAVARPWRTRYPADVQDIEQEALLGALDASRRYDPARGVSRECWSYWGARAGARRALGAIQAVRRPRDLKDRLFSRDESLDAVILFGRTRLDDVAGEPVDTDAREVSQLVRDALDALVCDPCDRGLVERHLLGGEPASDVGASYGMTRQAAHQRLKRLLPRVRRALMPLREVIDAR